MANSTSNKTTQNDTTSNGDGRYRFNLAKWIIIFVFSVTGILGLAALLAVTYSSTENFNSVKDILSILLPVLSAWAGTVLAFYFSRENFETAAQQTKELVNQFITSEEKLKHTLVNEVMIDIGKAIKLILDKAEKDIRLKADIIDAILAKENKERLPILDTQGHIKYMAHRSLFDKFIVQEVAAGKQAADLTLQDVLDAPPFKEVLTDSFKTVEATENLAKVKILMDKIKICSDVFATEDGTANSKVIGWVTNVIITEQAVV